MSLIRAFGSGIFDEDGNFDFESEEAVRGLEWIQGGVRRVSAASGKHRTCR